jgi:hypothetical protein
LRKKKCIYKITVTNWAKYNSGHKSKYKRTMIANNFCSDAKLRAVPVSVRWMFLAVLLTCGDMSSEVVEMSESVLREVLESSKSVSTALESLQSLQLLTFEKIDSLIPELIPEKKKKEIATQQLKVTKVEQVELSESAEIQPHQLPEVLKTKRKKINKADPVRIKTFDEFTQVVGTEIMNIWSKIYGDEEFLIREVEKSFAWMLTNPQKSTRTPKGWRQFFNNWFRTAWDDKMKKSNSRKHENTQVFRP